MVVAMKPPIFVRKLSTQERKALQDGLRSSNAFVLRRCQVLLASARGEIAPRIAENLGCAEQTVRNAIHEFNEKGLRSLKRSSRVRIYADSAYLINAFKEGWLDRWERSGWRKANKKPVMNADLWRDLLEVASPHEVEWIKV